MDFSIEVKNADENMLKALKAVLKTAPSVEFRMRREKNGEHEILAALKELDSGGGTHCSDFADYKKKSDE